MEGKTLAEIKADETLNAEPYFRAAMGFPASYDTKATASYLIGNYLGECAFTVDMAVAMEGKTFAEIKADAAMKAAWDALIGWWQTEPNEELHFFVTKHKFPEVAWSEVGFKSEGNVITLILDKALPLLKEDGSLSYQAAYNMASLPLVKQDLYETCKQKPVEGSTLWTTTYNTSVETCASWGPYKLTEFQAGKSYVEILDAVYGSSSYSSAKCSYGGVYEQGNVLDVVDYKDYDLGDYILYEYKVDLFEMSEKNKFRFIENSDNKSLKATYVANKGANVYSKVNDVKNKTF